MPILMIKPGGKTISRDEPAVHHDKVMPQTTMSTFRTESLDEIVKPRRFEVLDRDHHASAIFGDETYEYVSCNLCGANARIRQGAASFFCGIQGLAGHYRGVHEKSDGSNWTHEEVYPTCKREEVDTAVVEGVRNG